MGIHGHTFTRDNFEKHADSSFMMDGVRYTSLDGQGSLMAKRELVPVTKEMREHAPFPIVAFFRLYCNYQKELSAELDRICGKKQWWKTYRMLGNTEKRAHIGRGHEGVLNEHDSIHWYKIGFEHITGVLMTDEAATKLMVSLPDDPAHIDFKSDKAAIHSHHWVYLDPKARHYAAGFNSPKPMPWEQ